MSNVASSELVNVSKSTRSKGMNIALWSVQILLALQFVLASSGKLLGSPDMVGLFDAIGMGQWFRYVTGVVELTGAVLLVVPKTRAVGAGLLAGVMGGAIATHLFILHVSPVVPAVIFAFVGFVLWGRRAELARFIKR
jgi:uncharacterized membrane protein YphA (DoxX/SURF4 family)